jgi:deferrochelatase/peroxidase EfeB
MKPLLTSVTDFGFMDGISQPGITGFTANPTPGQTVIDPGNILVGETGDLVPRPAWAKDGSFLAFRQLKQLVPEFEKFLTDNPIIEPGLTPEQGSALMGARMVGRWKSVCRLIYRCSSKQFVTILFRMSGCPGRSCPVVRRPRSRQGPSTQQQLFVCSPWGR